MTIEKETDSIRSELDEIESLLGTEITQSNSPDIVSIVLMDINEKDKLRLLQAKKFVIQAAQKNRPQINYFSKDWN